RVVVHVVALALAGEAARRARAGHVVVGLLVAGADVVAAAAGGDGVRRVGLAAVAAEPITVQEAGVAVEAAETVRARRRGVLVQTDDPAVSAVRWIDGSVGLAAV